LSKVFDFILTQKWSLKIFLKNCISVRFSYAQRTEMRKNQLFLSII